MIVTNVIFKISFTKPWLKPSMNFNYNWRSDLWNDLGIYTQGWTQNEYDPKVGTYFFYKNMYPSFKLHLPP
jgi:hypothetical protein